MISDDRVKRAAKAICIAIGDDWNREGPRGLLSAYGPAARAALEADAAAITAAKVDGFREAAETISRLHIVHAGNSSSKREILNAIDARISALSDKQTTNTPEAKEG